MTQDNGWEGRDGYGGDAEQIEAARADAIEEEMLLDMMAGAHHFMIADPWDDTVPMEPVVVVFDNPTPRLSMAHNDMESDYSAAYNEEARRFADLMRRTMPQGLRDRVALNLMGDLMGLFCISHEGRTERDKRDLVVPSFFVQGTIVSKGGYESVEEG